MNWALPGFFHDVSLFGIVAIGGELSGRGAPEMVGMELRLAFEQEVPAKLPSVRVVFF